MSAFLCPSIAQKNTKVIFLTGQKLEPCRTARVQPDDVDAGYLHVQRVAHDGHWERSEVPCLELMSDLAPVSPAPAGRGSWPSNGSSQVERQFDKRVRRRVLDRNP